MIIIPSVLIKNAQCVQTTGIKAPAFQIYSNDPADIVGRWFDKGLNRIELVDIDGREVGKPVHAELISQLAFRFPNLSFQVRGGIRNVEQIEFYLNAGVEYVILGTKALLEPEFVLKLASSFPGKILVDIDVLDNKVRIENGSKELDLTPLEIASQFEQPGVEGIIYSNISTALGGINIDAIVDLAEQTSIPLIVSGGIEDMDDVRALVAESYKGIVGAVSTSPINNGCLDVLEAHAYCEEFNG